MTTKLFDSLVVGKLYKVTRTFFVYTDTHGTLLQPEECVVILSKSLRPDNSIVVEYLTKDGVGHNWLYSLHCGLLELVSE